MAENPYRSPAAGETTAGVRAGRQVDLLGVARYQRVLICSIIIHLAIVALAPVRIHEATPPAIWLILSFVNLGIVMLNGVLALIVGWNVFHPAIGLVLGILAFVPCLGLIPLLLINGKASRVLKANGVRVGLLGALDLSPIHEARAQERME